MKLIYDFNETERSMKCYYEDNDGIRYYVDFWDIKTDDGALVRELKSWKPTKIRIKNHKVLKQKREEIIKMRK